MLTAGRQMPHPLPSHDPPFTINRPLSDMADVHSKTCPAESRRPNGLAPAGYNSTGTVSNGPLSALFTIFGSNLCPLGKRPPSVLLAVFSNSISRGSAIAAQYFGSHRSGRPRGKPGPPDEVQAPAAACTAMHGGGCDCRDVPNHNPAMSGGRHLGCDVPWPE